MLGAVLYKIADADADSVTNTFTLSAPKEEAVGYCCSRVDVDTLCDAIGEITLTTGKDSDPSTTAIPVSRDAAVLMLGMAKEDIGWDSWETQGQGILGPIFPTSQSTFNVTTNPKDEKVHLWVLRGR
jgi:hypothetical protein